jgi:fibronectin type 3 domain-containing protein
MNKKTRRYFTLASIILFGWILFSGCPLDDDNGGNGGGPVAPSKPKAEAIDKNSIRISWTSVSGAASYKIYRSVTSTGRYDYIDSTEDNYYTNTNLQPRETYYYKVTSINIDGQESNFSVYTGATTNDENNNKVESPPDAEDPNNGDNNPPALGAPYGLTATSPSKSSITITWNAVTGATSYRIYQSTSATGTFSSRGISATTSYTDTGLTASTMYYYKVAAINAKSEGPQSNTASVTTQANMGAIPDGFGLAQAIDYISAQVDQGTTYDITVHNNDFLDPQVIMTLGKNVTVYIHSPSTDAVNTITLNSNGTLFTVDNNITVKLENIILKGRSSNDASLVRVVQGGTLIMESGSAVTDNTNSGDGGGIYIDRGTVTMNNGRVSGNKAANGGGFYISGSDALFTLAGGEIAANTATSHGGGMYLITQSKALMTGGIIKGNTANIGGGVSLHMDYISTNFAKTCAAGSTTSGVIYGSTGNADLANTASLGAAIFVQTGGYIVRDRMLGALDEISTDNLSEGWD